jgi:hypothetical protein
MIEQDLFKAIKPAEFLDLSWQRRDKAARAPNILAMIKHFNKVSVWVYSEIVCQEDFKQRIATLRHFVHTSHVQQMQYETNF